jgi:hypothetical protein
MTAPYCLELVTCIEIIVSQLAPKFLLLFLSKRRFPGSASFTPGVSGEGGLVLMPLPGLEVFGLAGARHVLVTGLVGARFAGVRFAGVEFVAWLRRSLVM